MTQHGSGLAERRREFEAELDALRADLEERIGWSPRGRWVLPLLGVAMGFSAALFLAGLRGRKRRRRRLR
ncbi:MAG: hypothetical protein ACM3OB_03060 [Acidobacteriota bacterium]